MSKTSEPAVSFKDQDNTLVELLYDQEKKETSLGICRDGEIDIKDHYIDTSGRRLIPCSPENNLIKHGAILFPSKPVEYESKKSLLSEVVSFLHRYVDLDSTFEKIAAHYVLLTWLYDGFNELPYLRKGGEFGSGKTRFLQTIGSVCYKPVFASGASTVSPIFYILDFFGGTLLVDEADFRFSDAKSEIVKILNNGNAKGFPILRSVQKSTKAYSPRAFRVFGPKIVAMRGEYQDRALESRFITDSTPVRKLREDIPITLPDVFHLESLTLRNKLLMFRFRNLLKTRNNHDILGSNIEPRLRQIYSPLLSVVGEEALAAEIVSRARDDSESIKIEKGRDIEQHVLEIIMELYMGSTPLAIREIAVGVYLKYGNEHIRAITPKWIGSIIRNRLGLRTVKSNGIYVIPYTERKKIEGLFDKYNLH